jgi:membrane-associated phospholipid phosphatase
MTVHLRRIGFPLLSLAAALTAAACSEHPTAPASASASRTSFSGGAPQFGLAPASLDWNAEARSLIGANKLTPLAASRVLASLGVAEYRAVLAAEDDHDANGRSGLEAERGAVAGASQSVLSFFFPAAAQDLQAITDAQAHATPGEIQPFFSRGLAIGQAQGAAIVTRAQSDGFTTPFTGTIPTGPGLWIPKGPPAGPTFGGVTPWLLTSGSQFRPGPPPAFGSDAFHTALQEIRTISDTRTAEQTAIANFWNFPAGSFTPPGYWNSVTSDYVTADGLGEEDAAHAFALTHAALMDALIACWDAKYTYWLIRPPQADPMITTVFALPNHPSYPSGHSCGSSAAVTVLSTRFPARTSELEGWLSELGLSRMYAGIHYRFDIETGTTIGTSVGQWAIARDAEGKLASR